MKYCNTPGVTFDTDKQKYRVQLKYLGRNRYIGLFTDVNDAIKARKNAEIKYRGK